MNNLASRFFARVAKSEKCWLWTGAKGKFGYGVIKHSGKQIYAHRVSWELHNGPIGDWCVLHKCDVPGCVNPSHLFLGTKADNAADRDAKKRHRAPRKLTIVDVGVIRSAAGAVSNVALAAEFGVTEGAIRAVIAHRTWAHIK